VIKLTQTISPNFSTNCLLYHGNNPLTPVGGPGRILLQPAGGQLPPSSASQQFSTAARRIQLKGKPLQTNWTRATILKNGYEGFQCGTIYLDQGVHQFKFGLAGCTTTNQQLQHNTQEPRFSTPAAFSGDSYVNFLLVTPAASINSILFGKHWVNNIIPYFMTTARPSSVDSQLGLRYDACPCV